MVGIFIISWRESIEAALLVGILLVYLKKIGKQGQSFYIYLGVLFGIFASILFGYASNRVSYLFDGIREDILGTLVLLVAVVMLTYMVIWMSDQAKHLKGRYQQKIDEVFENKKLWTLALLAFTGVFREGVETVLFLWGIVLQNQEVVSLSLSLASGLGGLILAVVMAYFFFKGFGFLDLRKFFNITGLLLLFMSAGMLMAAVGKLESASLISPILSQVWNSAWLIDEHSLFGHFLSGFLGYRAKPSLMEIIAYVVYFVAISLWIWKPFPRKTRSKALVH
ncbi:MAG: FTR1 family protein [Nitrospiria bacterium]